MNRPGRVNFATEAKTFGLRLCVGEIHPGNFLKDPDDPDGPITVIDFGATNLLPPSFFLHGLNWAM